MPAEEKLPPVFKFSIYTGLIAWTIYLAIIVYATARDVPGFLNGTISGGPNALHYFIIVDIIWASLIPSFLIRRERKIILTESRVTINGWRTHVDAPYSQVSSVSLVYVRDLRIPTPLRGVQLRVNGYEKPFVIPRNSKIGKSKTPLYSWLSAKIQQTQDQGGLN